MFVIVLDIAFVVIPHPDPHGQVTVSSRPREVPILSCRDMWNLWRPTVDQAINHLKCCQLGTCFYAVLGYWHSQLFLNHSRQWLNLPAHHTVCIFGLSFRLLDYSSLCILFFTHFLIMYSTNICWVPKLSDIAWAAKIYLVCIKGLTVE